MRWLCEGILKPHFRPQLHGRGLQIFFSAWLWPRAVQCQAELQPEAAILGSTLLSHLPSVPLGMCSWPLFVFEARNPETAGWRAEFLQETPRIRLCFTAGVTYPCQKYLGACQGRKFQILFFFLRLYKWAEMSDVHIVGVPDVIHF